MMVVVVMMRTRRETIMADHGLGHGTRRSFSLRTSDVYRLFGKSIQLGGKESISQNETSTRTRI